MNRETITREPPPVYSSQLSSFSKSTITADEFRTPLLQGDSPPAAGAPPPLPQLPESQHPYLGLDLPAEHLRPATKHIRISHENPSMISKSNMTAQNVKRDSKQGTELSALTLDYC
jgi:hypothetical protein